MITTYCLCHPEHTSLIQVAQSSGSDAPPRPSVLCFPANLALLTPVYRWKPEEFQAELPDSLLGDARFLHGRVDNGGGLVAGEVAPEPMTGLRTWLGFPHRGS